MHHLKYLRVTAETLHIKIFMIACIEDYTQADLLLWTAALLLRVEVLPPPSLRLSEHRMLHDPKDVRVDGIEWWM